MKQIHSKVKISLLVIPLTLFCIISHTQAPEDSLISILKSSKNSIEKINALNKLSSILRYKRPADSESYANEADSLSHELKYHFGEISACYNLAVLNDLKGNYIKGEGYYSRGIEIINRINSDSLKKRLPTLYQGLANNYMGRGDFKNSIIYFRKLFQLANNDKQLQTSALIGMANIYNYTGAHDSSIFYYEKGLKESTELKDSNSIANCLNNLGGLFIRREQFQKALDYQVRAKDIYDRRKNFYGLASSYKNLGIIYSELGDKEKAKEHYLIALNYALTHDYRSEVAGIYVSLGDFYSKLGESNEALKNFKSANEIFVLLGNSYGIATSALNIGIVLFDIGRYNEAVTNLNKIEQLIKEIDMKELSMEYYKARSEMHNKIAQYKLAYEDHLLYSVFKDSIFNDKKEHSIQEIEAKYKILEREKENSQLKLKNLENENSIRKQKNLKLLFLSGVFILGFVIYLIIRGNRIKSMADLVKQRSDIRQKISKDLHDDLGSGLTKIGMLGEAAISDALYQRPTRPHLLQEIKLHSKNLIDNLGELVWATNPENDNLASLFTKIRDFTYKFLENSNIEPEIGLSDNTASFETSPEANRNIYLILKEGLTNAVKHSGADKIEIEFLVLENKSFKFEIRDNGKGFDISTASEGNGRKNLEKRALEFKEGKFQLLSEIGKGTTITVKGSLR